MLERSSAGALATVLRGSAVPYGFALTVWAAHDVLADRHGSPGILEVALFILGSVAAFGLLAAVAERLSPRPLPPQRGDLVRAGAIHVLAIGSAFGAAAALALVDGVAAWALGAFAATAIYLSVASLEIVIAHRIERDLERR